MLRWLWDNLSSLLLAFILALTVWVAAVLAEDPSETRTLGPLTITYSDPSEGLLVVGELPRQAEITVRAPASVWQEIDTSRVQLSVDLSGLEQGLHEDLPIGHSIDQRPARVISIEPRSVDVRLEAAASRAFEIQVQSVGEPRLGYRLAGAEADPATVLVIGPASAVARVQMVRATVNINGLSDDQILTETLVPVDANGDRVDDVGLEIETAAIRLDMEQLERYRLVSVIPIIEGQELLEAEGYLVANVSVSPSQVIVFSSDAQALQSLPGFVETTPLDLASSTSDVQRRLALDLPEGISLVGDQSVLVQVDINPIEISITITRPIEFRGLGQGLFASASPDTVDIILKGPQPTLRLLEESDVRVILNLLDLVQGAHQILPEVVVSQTNIEVSAVQPESIEVTISDTPPPTASPSPLPPGTPEP